MKMVLYYNAALKDTHKSKYHNEKEKIEAQ